MYFELIIQAIPEIVLQRVANHGEGEFVPGNIGFVKEAHRFGLSTRGKNAVDELSAVEKVDLRYVRETEHGVQLDVHHLGLGFLPGFPRSTCLCGFTVLQKSAGKVQNPLRGRMDRLHNST